MHEKTTWELSQKILKSNYQFRKKAHEIQFNFNSEVEDSITSAKEELKKVKAPDGPGKEAIKKAESLLNKGLKTIKKRQKHIKVADRLEFGWATVEHYECHPPAAYSDDEKHLEKAEKETCRKSCKQAPAWW